MLIDSLKAKKELYSLHKIFNGLDKDLAQLQKMLDDQKDALENALKNKKLIEISKIKKEVYKVKVAYLNSFSYKKITQYVTEIDAGVVEDLSNEQVKPEDLLDTSGK
jgi:hypothetical protein